MFFFNLLLIWETNENKTKWKYKMKKGKSKNGLKKIAKQK